MSRMIEPHSSTWAAVEAWANEQIERNRLTLESVGLDATHTATIRGRIATLRELLALPNPPPLPSIEKTDTYGL